MAASIHQLWNLGYVKSSDEEGCRFQQPSRLKSNDLLWKEYFRDPSQWWDCRNRKAGPGHPHFKHKISKTPLWIDSWNNPSWVGEELRRRGLAMSTQAQLCDRVTHKILPCNDEVSDFVALLRTCAKNKDLNRGTQLHDNILEKGLLEKCVDGLVTMYAKCGALQKAQELLDTHKSRNVPPWTALIAGYVKQGQAQDALNCFDRMQHEGLSPDAVTFACILKACGSIKAPDRAEQIHHEIARQGLLENDIVLGNSLVDMYVKCGALTKAHQALDELPCRDVVSWSSLIAGYAQQGQAEQALNCLEQMQHEGLSPYAVTFACILKACGTIRAAKKGEEIHDEIAKQGLLANSIVLGNALVDMYAKCGALAKAQQVLEELPSRDVVSWNALITGYTQQGQGEQALICLDRMQREGFSPNSVTFTCILKACGTVGTANKGKQIHDEIARRGLLKDDIVLSTALVDMYAKCGVFEKAQQVLEGLPSRDVVSWNALIAGYTEHGQGEQALKCFEQMQREGIPADRVTFACILRACGTIKALDKGEEMHDKIARQGYLANNIVLGNALVDMYAKCGALVKAQKVLEELPSRDVISWSTLISGYAEDGQGEQALHCFERMQGEGLSPNSVTFACILKACGAIGAVDMGEQIHDEIAREGLIERNIVLGNALVDMYAKCGALVKAQRVLEELPSRDVVSWNALIAGYSQNGQGEQALICLERMQCEGVAPDAVTFVCILKACGTIGAIDKGEQFHDEIDRQGLLGNDIVLGTALVDMYAKCGSLARAQHVLKKLPSRDVASWNALIMGYAQECLGEQILNCFEQMQQEGLSPNEVTFSCVLNACSHLGLVEDGHMYFINMSTKYGIKPSVEHYTCMIDLFGRAGHVNKAVRMIQEMPCSDYSTIWCALLGGCQKWGDVTVGKWAFEHAVKLDRSDGAAYVLMANIYAAADMQEDAESIEAMRAENQAWKF